MIFQKDLKTISSKVIKNNFSKRFENELWWLVVKGKEKNCEDIDSKAAIPKSEDVDEKPHDPATAMNDAQEPQCKCVLG